MNRLKVIKFLIMMSSLMQFSLTASAQILFEKGFITLNDGNRTECYIKNIGWRYNPVEVTYKLFENSDAKTAKVQNVSEFEITGSATFKRYTVDIDQSQESLTKISDIKEPEYLKQQVFLKVLVSGKATLFAYETSDISKYFIQRGNENPEPLIHKTYKPDQTSVLSENNTYKNQLLAWFGSANFTLSDVEKINYNSRDLTKIVKDYNETAGEKTIVYNATDKKTRIHLNIRPGATFNNATVQNAYYPYYTIDFGYKAGMRIGAEAELTFPFNQNKWAVFLEPVFTNYSSSYTKNNSYGANYHASIKYSSIETHIGPRYSIYLKKDQRVFINGAFVIDIPISSKFHENIPYNDIAYQFTIGVSGGAGYMLSKKIGIECRYTYMDISRKDFADAQKSSYKGASLIFSYTIF